MCLKSDNIEEVPDAAVTYFKSIENNAASNLEVIDLPQEIQNDADFPSEKLGKGTKMSGS